MITEKTKLRTRPRSSSRRRGRPRRDSGYNGAEIQRWPIAILGVAFDAVTMDEALARIAQMVGSGNSHYVVTPNVDFLAQARRDVELRQILLEAHMVLCDGMPLVWASRWLGNSLPERVAGADLAPRLLAQAERFGHRLFLLGATPAANAAAVARLRERYPALPIAGHYSPPFQPLDEMNHGEIIARVRAARPDIVLVSFGCPKQEKWMAHHYRELGVPVCIGVGAVIDFLAGQAQRAPEWMRQTGLEWAYRLCREPRRLWARYAGDLQYFLPAISAQCWQMRRWQRRSGPRGSVTLTRVMPGWVHAQVSGCLDRAAIDAAARAWLRIGAGRSDCSVDLAGVSFIDSTGAALLWERRKRLAAAGRRLVLHDPSSAVRQTLTRMGFIDFFEIGRAGTPERISNRAA